MARLQTAVERYVAPAGRDAARATVVDAARARLYAAEEGSDLQLAWALLFIRLATADEDLATIGGLLDGSAPIAGLETDFNVRWTIVATLASAGRIGAGGIEAELARDRTTAGTAYAFGALAARPDAAAKADAWAMATGQERSHEGDAGRDRWHAAGRPGRTRIRPAGPGRGARPVRRAVLRGDRGRLADPYG